MGAVRLGRLGSGTRVRAGITCGSDADTNPSNSYSPRSSLGLVQRARFSILTFWRTLGKVAVCDHQQRRPNSRFAEDLLHLSGSPHAGRLLASTQTAGTTPTHPDSEPPCCISPFHTCTMRTMEHQLGKQLRRMASSFVRHIGLLHS